ncbi:hypothetical protein MC7420_3642 [Coleofasciculus chthonoplastes PCC 7420]|uniref:Uncharacterized protein n=1 Tax=Coleofasciculus chthonoplastes PCC 7420 TaxID=118168 RepID=B4VX30_9CYAN|nr:hypothetical protein MC7420_3642 [Coleofasciculus chthonoplastes PCC 7420]
MDTLSLWGTVFAGVGAGGDEASAKASDALKLAGVGDGGGLRGLWCVCWQ